MWLVNKTASTIYQTTNKNIKKISENMPNLSNISTNIPTINISKVFKVKKPIQNKKSLVQQKIKQILKNKKQIMPTNTMNKVAQMSYQSDKFQQICILIINKLDVFKYESKKAKQTLNTLVLVCFLIKHGASGFIDEFRNDYKIFQQHSQLSLANAYTNDQKQLSQLRPLLTEIRQRAKYITILLTDKKKLLKEKQIAMKIKQKIILNEQISSKSQSKFIQNYVGNEQFCKTEEKNKISEKLDAFLEHYVWKYWNKFDEKMQTITEKIIQRIDQYLDMQQPESFQIDQLQINQTQTVANQQKTQNQTLNIAQNQITFIKNKHELDIQQINESGPVLNTQLI